MSHVLGIFAALLAFLASLGAVAVTESLIEALYPFSTDLPLAEQHNYSLDEYARENVLTEYIDFNVRGVHVGTPEKEMLKIFGKPKKVDYVPADPDEITLSTYEFEGLTIGVQDFEGERRALNFSIESDQWNVQGITVGSSVEDIERVFGRPRSVTNEDLYYLDSSNLDVDFAIENGRVVGIYLLYDGC